MAHNHHHRGNSHHHHAPDHDHSHPTAAANAVRLSWTLAVIGTFLVIEVVGGLLTHSLALLADAGHMLTDVASLVIAIYAQRLALRPASPSHSFGLLRAEVMGALINGATLVAMVFWIFWEAFRRITEPPEVLGAMMMLIAGAGLVANIVAALILHAGSKESLNMQGAFVHVLGDLLGSIGALVAGGIIWLTGWQLADPLVSVFIGLIILFSSFNLLRRSVNILINATPEEIDYEAVRSALEEIPHVIEVHDLHIWSISHGNPSLSAHLRLAPDCADTAHWQVCLRQTQDMLREKFNITHTTLQLEPTAYEKDGRSI
jgi:cobalt-zinc-cadmium efflux system protein